MSVYRYRYSLECREYLAHLIWDHRRRWRRQVLAIDRSWLQRFALWHDEPWRATYVLTPEVWP